MAVPASVALGFNARVLLGDSRGYVRAETNAMLRPLSWKLNDYSQGGLIIARSDPAFSADNLRFGNKMLVQFDNGLPDWGGQIEPTRKWTEAAVDVVAYSGEYILSQRRTGKRRAFVGATVGTIFKSIITEANDEGDMGIVLGEVWGGGPAHSPEYNLASLLDIIKNDLCGRLSPADFYLEPALVNGRIIFYAHLYERRGRDLTNVALIEGHNASGIALAEQGPLVTEWVIAGADTDGNGWGDGRLTSRKRDVAAVSAYGLRQDSRVYNDIALQLTLDETATNLLEDSKTPHNVLDIPEALNLAPARFADYDVGDAVRVWAPSYGFDGGTNAMVQVTGREFMPDKGTCRLLVREEIE